MLNSRNKQKKRILVLLLIIMALSFINFNILRWNSNIHNKDDKFNEYNSLDEYPKLATYPASLNGTGMNLNITLHQSYLNNSFNTIVNTSIVNGNNFTLPCPNDVNFNSTFTNITIKDIYAPNKSLIIEDDGPNAAEDFLNSVPCATSFTLIGDGYLENVSVYLANSHLTKNATVQMVLYKSDWVSGISKPLTVVDQYDWYKDLITFEFPNNTYDWYTVTGLHEFLDNSLTDNNTWFIGLFDIGVAAGDAQWYYTRDLGSLGGDGVDETKSYKYSGGNWQLVTHAGPPLSYVDFNTKIELAPYKNIPNATDITLQINGDSVSDIDSGYGYWESTKVNGSDSGYLYYNVSANWWDVTCNISQVQINYTKTNLFANSTFKIQESGGIVQWNVTHNGGFNYFSSIFNKYWINFTVPKQWSNFRAFNGTDELTANTTLGPPKGKYREFQIYNFSNGANWYITAESSNLLNEILIFIESFEMYEVDFTDTIDIFGNFSDTIENGNATIEIYSPDPTGNYLNHTNYNDTITPPSKEVSIGNWTIEDTALDYGVFITRMGWNNGTAAGFQIGNFTILGVSDLKTYLPDDVFYANEKFNITLEFNDTGQEKPIIGGDISYSIEGSPFTTENVTDLLDGNYTITIDCNDTRFGGYGLKSVEIYANQTFYNNQSKIVQFTILGNTTLNYYNFVNNSNYDSSQNFNITLEFYDEIKELGVDSANINYSLNGGLDYRDDNVDPYSNGKYNITIFCNDVNFTNYGPQIIIVNINKSYYENQTIIFYISITGDTDLTFTKWPDKIFYYSDEIFNITAYYNDTSRDTGISGALITVEVDETQYFPDWKDIGGGYYNITINCSHIIYSNYGHFDLRINMSRMNYYEASVPSFDLIIGNTTLAIINPADNSVFIDRQIFNITIEYNDVVKDLGIGAAEINYSINGGNDWRYDNVTYIGNGIYNITIDCNDTQFISFGFVDIIINASKQYYNNLSQTLKIHRQITTTIDPSINPDLGSIIRGLNISYTFNYTDYQSNPIIGASWANLTYDGFKTHLKDWGNGTYTIKLNTTKVIVSSYSYIFIIYAVGNETQTITLTIDVTIIETRIDNLLWNTYFARNAHLNQTVRFYFNDTTNNDFVPNLETDDVTVRNYATGAEWDTGDFNWRVRDLWGNGTYFLDISTNGLNSGSYTLQIEAYNYPNYDISIAFITFYLRGNFTQLEIISISDIGGEGLLTSIDDDYACFEGRNLFIDFNITDLDFSNQLVTGQANSYIITFTDILNSSNSGFLSNVISYDANTNTFKGNFNASRLRVGIYTVEITVVKTNYEDSIYSFNLEIKAKYEVRISVVYQPEEVTAGDSFILIIKAEYNNGSIWMPLVGADIIIIPYFDGVQGTATAPVASNNTGEARFVITVGRKVGNMTLVVLIQEVYNYFGASIEISDIIVKQPPGGIEEQLIQGLIIGGSVIAVVGASIGVYRGVVVPKKREKARVLAEVKTIFDDAINLEHILILYKGTGTCVFFKSFGTEEIDPELISGFITAISSFGKDLVAQEELNEVSYGDKMLLLSDGEFIRVALVLTKKASLILRTNLKKFIVAFEETYTNELPNWRGQLNLFRDAGGIIDDILNTSIILPQEITYKFASVKALKTTHSRDVLKLANNLMKDSERNFFFIATLLKEATEKTNKETGEIFMGIKELREIKILMPIEISTIEAAPVSQQELTLIKQKVSKLVDLSPEEQQKLTNNLTEMNPAEREAYFVSLEARHEIISAPIEEKPSTAVISNKKDAKKEIKSLKKLAQTAKKEKDYDRAVKIYQNAAEIASNWELSNEFFELDDIVRVTKIEDLRIKMKQLEKEADAAAKSENYNEAAQKYKMSSKLASEIFKLGEDLTKEVKRLSNKAKEYEKLA